MNALFKHEGIGRLTMLGKCLFLFSMLLFGYIGLVIGAKHSFFYYIIRLQYYPQIIGSSFIVFILTWIMFIGFKYVNQNFRATRFKLHRLALRIVFYGILPIIASIGLGWLFFLFMENKIHFFESDWFSMQFYLIISLCLIVALFLERYVPVDHNIGETNGTSEYVKTSTYMMYYAKDKKTGVVERGGREFVKNMSLKAATKGLPEELYFNIGRAGTIHKDNIVCAYHNEYGKIFIVSRWGPREIMVPDTNGPDFQAWAMRVGVDILPEKPNG